MKNIIKNTYFILVLLCVQGLDALPHPITIAAWLTTTGTYVWRKKATYKKLDLLYSVQTEIARKEQLTTAQANPTTTIDAHVEQLINDNKKTTNFPILSPRQSTPQEQRIRFSSMEEYKAYHQKAWELLKNDKILQSVGLTTLAITCIDLFDTKKKNPYKPYEGITTHSSPISRPQPRTITIPTINPDPAPTPWEMPDPEPIPTPPPVPFTQITPVSALTINGNPLKSTLDPYTHFSHNDTLYYCPSSNTFEQDATILYKYKNELTRYNGFIHFYQSSFSSVMALVVEHNLESYYPILCPCCKEKPDENHYLNAFFTKEANGNYSIFLPSGLRKIYFESNGRVIKEELITNTPEEETQPITKAVFIGPSGKEYELKPDDSGDYYDAYLTNELRGLVNTNVFYCTQHDVIYAEKPTGPCSFCKQYHNSTYLKGRIKLTFEKPKKIKAAYFISQNAPTQKIKIDPNDNGEYESPIAFERLDSFKDFYCCLPGTSIPKSEFDQCQNCPHCNQTKTSQYGGQDPRYQGMKQHVSGKMEFEYE